MGKNDILTNLNIAYQGAATRAEIAKANRQLGDLRDKATDASRREEAKRAEERGGGSCRSGGR